MVRHRSTLPAEVTSFVGRRQELREVKRLLTTTRLVRSSAMSLAISS